MNAKIKGKILITGGAGFIGSHLLRRMLSTEGCGSVVILDDFSVGRKENLSDLIAHDGRVEMVSGDVRDGSLVESLLDGVDLVYHLAAVVGVDRVLAKPFDTWDVEVNGTKTLLEKCEATGVKRFFLASSSECYGKYDLSKGAMKESDVVIPNTYYGQAKLECERMCHEFNASGRMSCVSVRYFNVYGDRQSFNGYVIPNMINEALNNMPVRIYGDGSQGRDFVHVDDAVDATLMLAESGHEGLYNIGYGRAIKIADLARLIIELTKSKSEIVNVPIRRPTDLESKLCDNTKIRETLGWTPSVDFIDGLKRTIEYFKRCSNECNCSMRSSG